MSAHAVWWNASIYYAVTSAEALRRLGHDVTLIAHHSIPAYQQSVRRGLHVIGDVNLRDLNPGVILRNQIILKKLLQENKFDLLNPHRPEDHFHLALANRISSSKVKLVRTVSDVRVPAGNFFNRFLHQNWTDGLIYCAHCCRRRYHQTRFSLEALPEAVIYSALDTKIFSHVKDNSENPYKSLGAPIIGMVARLSPNKGHRTVIEAASFVRRELPQAHFLIVGQEEEISIASLKEYARGLRVEEAFTFTGRLDDPRQAMAACDLGIIASTESEVISRAAQEFFTLGVPVIATTINVLPEMVEAGVNGLLFPPGDSHALARAIIEIAGSSQKRETMSRAALDTARNRHDLSVLGSQTEAFFDSVLKDRVAS